MLNSVLTNGFHVVGDYRNLSDDTISKVLEIISSYSNRLYLTIDAKKGNYVLMKIPQGVGDEEYVALRNFGRLQIGNICTEKLEKSKVDLILFSARFRKIIERRYGNESEVYLNLFKKLLISEPIPFELYNSAKPLTKYNHTLCDVIDELMICNSILRDSIESKPVESLQLVNSFCIGLTMEKGLFRVGIFKDYYIEKRKLTLEAKEIEKEKKLKKEEDILNTKVISYKDIVQFVDSKGICYLEDLFGVSDSHSYKFFCSDKGLDLLYSVFENCEGIYFHVNDYDYHFKKYSIGTEFKLLSKDTISVLISDDYYKHYLKEGYGYNYLRYYKKTPNYDRSNLRDLMFLSLEIGRLLDCECIILVKSGKGYIYTNIKENR